MGGLKRRYCVWRIGCMLLLSYGCDMTGFWADSARRKADGTQSLSRPLVGDSRRSNRDSGRWRCDRLLVVEAEGVLDTGEGVATVRPCNRCSWHRHPKAGRRDEGEDGPGDCFHRQGRSGNQGRSRHTTVLGKILDVQATQLTPSLFTQITTRSRLKGAEAQWKTPNISSYTNQAVTIRSN